MENYKYEYTVEGKVQNDELPFNPLGIGFKLVNKKPCCLFFENGTHELRVKTATKNIILRKLGKSRPLTSGLLVPSSQDSLIQTLKNHGVNT